MNKTCYRIIFNKSRQQLMAVAEIVSEQGKNGTRKGCKTRNPLPASGMHGGGLLFKAVAIFTLMSLGAASFAADIVAAPNATAGKQPTVIQAPSGIPVVQIAAPHHCRGVAQPVPAIQCADR
jgi:filamentous hemagglutinin